MVVDTLYGEGTPRNRAELPFSLDSAMESAFKSLYKSHSKPSDFVPEELFTGIAKTLDSAVSDDFGKEYPELAGLIHDNNEVFAAFKVHDQCSRMAELLTGEDGSLLDFEEWRKIAEPIATHHNRVWLRTEYDTAVKRAEQAREWMQFRDEKDVLPNLRWVPSTAANPGADHIVFWDTVRPVDDPFWSQHKPGDRWGCQCSLEATDDPETPVPETVFQDPDAGLDNNPADDGKLFSDSHPYYPSSCSTCPFNTGGANTSGPTNKARDCANCSYLKNCIASNLDTPNTGDVYKKLLKEGHYQAEYDEHTGGLKATHNEHNTQSKGWAYEQGAQNAGFNRGDCVILEKEIGGGIGQRYTEGKWNGLEFEVAGCETGTSNNIRNGLKHCASKKVTEVAVLVFPSVEFDMNAFKVGLQKYNGLEKLNDGQYLKFKKILCVQNEKIILELDL